MPDEIFHLRQVSHGDVDVDFDVTTGCERRFRSKSAKRCDIRSRRELRVSNVSLK